MISLTETAKYVHLKWSTWLAIASASSGAGLIAYAAMPQGAQDAFPHLLLSAMSVMTVIGPLLVPLATSLKQSSIPPEGQ